MLLIINGDEVPFSLEQEKTARQVVGSLADWLESQAWEILVVKLNGEDFFGRPELLDLPVQEILKLEITARDWKAKAQDELGMLRDFFAGLAEAAAGGEGVVLRDRLARWADLRPLLTRQFGQVKGRTGIWVGLDTVAQAVDNPGSDPRLLAEGAKILAEGFSLLLDERLNPETAFENSLGRLSVLLPNVREISLKLQLGKDREAMNVLLVLLSTLEDLTRQWDFLRSVSSPAVAEKEARTEVSRLFADLNQFLKETVAAFETKDYILVGDLLEYEISPRLETFAGLKNA